VDDVPLAILPLARGSSYLGRRLVWYTLLSCRVARGFYEKRTALSDHGQNCQTHFVFPLVAYFQSFCHFSEYPTDDFHLRNGSFSFRYDTYRQMVEEETDRQTTDKLLHALSSHKDFVARLSSPMLSYPATATL
jgi:hypothetical protein